TAAPKPGRFAQIRRYETFRFSRTRFGRVGTGPTCPFDATSKSSGYFWPKAVTGGSSVNGRIHFSLTLIVKGRFKLCTHDSNAWSAAHARLPAQDVELA